jgi:hypothetical protein
MVIKCSGKKGYNAAVLTPSPLFFFHTKLKEELRVPLSSDNGTT